MDGIKCRVEFEAGCDSKTVFMDKKLLRHILMNLLSNAVKYSGDKATVWLILSCSNGYIDFVVKDEGIGIPPEDQGYLFDPFFRADNVSNIPGSGLGLSIVKNCVDLHRGSISFESTMGIGTKFLVSLPYES
jgi:signal transduction histidine kinase